MKKEPYFTFINSRLPGFEIKTSYNVGGWGFRTGRKPKARYSKLQLLPFSYCKDVFMTAYRRIKHNLACAILEEGGFLKVMATIFHFSIFDIDRVC